MRKLCKHCGTREHPVKQDKQCAKEQSNRAIELATTAKCQFCWRRKRQYDTCACGAL